MVAERGAGVNRRILTVRGRFTRLANLLRGRRSQVVRQRSAKPPFAGSIPAVASIHTPPHFNFASTVVSHGWYLLAPFRWVRDEQTLHRPEILGGKTVDLRISFDGALRVDGADDSDELRRKLTRMFQLGIDIGEFVSLSRNSPTHTWVEESGFGRLLCGATPFEDVVKIITTTNTMWRQTMRMTELLVEKCGRKTKSARAFPTPKDVARFSADELQEDCRLGYRSKTIHALATGIADGSICHKTPTTPTAKKEKRGAK